MTQRLYYENSYLTLFSATVTGAFARNARETVIYLDRSAFYPTSGGQPFDTGTLGGVPVSDVFVDKNGDVAHVIEGVLTVGSTVEGTVDWGRRFDHMQQHAGEHMIAGCLHRLFNGYTIGLHLGHEDSSIDVELPGGRMHLTEDEIESLEEEVNAHIFADEPIRCYFPGDNDVDTLPLRKKPSVREHIRVVQIGEWEYCACGGTHPSSTGQIGLVKIIDARPSKGKLRLSFVCGERAFRYFRGCFKTVKKLSTILSAEQDKLCDTADALIVRQKDAVYELNKLKAAQAVNIVKKQMDATEPAVSLKIVKCLFDDPGTEGMKLAADAVCARSGYVALLGSRSREGINLLFAKNGNVDADMGKLLSDLVKRSGGKGGGRPDFARGSTLDETILDRAEDILLGREA